MTVDLEAIARRQRCEASELRIALPLLEQGYEPPFLTRYRRDELGPVPERALWEMVAAIRTDRQLEQRREELRAKYREGELDDDALLASIAHAQTPRQLDRIARRIRKEAGNAQPASRLAVRLLNPKPNDPVELSELAELVVGPEDASAAAEALDTVLGQYLAADSRMVQAASRWMDKHVRLHVVEVHDPHEGSADAAAEHEDPDDPAGGEEQANKAPASAPHAGAAPQEPASPQEPHSKENSSADAPPSTATEPADSAPQAPAAEGAQAAPGASPVADASAGSTPQPEPAGPQPEPADGTGEAAAADAAASAIPAADSSAEPAPAEPAPAEPAPAEPAPAEPAPAEPEAATSEGADQSAAEAKDQSAAEAKDQPSAEGKPAKTSKRLKGSADAAAGAAPKKKKEAQRKKISPRQRRRRWLVSVLQPLSGKSLPKAKLTAFQVVMLGRALRSQVARCAFKYDAAELVDVLAKTAASFNKGASSELSQIVIDNEAAIREALEGAWWDDLIDRAARRLISIAADSLRRQMHREPIEARNVLVIDAVGPRTAAIAVVGLDDSVLHTEDLPCQLSKSVRQQLVARLGELVHQFHVDLIVLSNGPARRSCMVALSELLAHSQGGSLRWTLADRAGAETYAGGPEGNRELRSTPRRFRAAVWLAQLVRSPARALAKVDPSKLRLGSYQRELAEKPLSDSLQDVVTSGVSQISVDTNAADRGWLASLPGVTNAVAEAIDRQRRQSLFSSRQELLTLDAWPDAVASRQAAGFLRVFGGEQPLDATAIHPDDYALAEKLMARLEIPPPPSAPPGYEPPRFDIDESKSAATEPQSEGPKFSEVKIATVDPDSPFGALPEGESPAEPGTEAPLAEPSAEDAARPGEEASTTAELKQPGTQTPPAETPASEESPSEAPASEEAQGDAEAPEDQPTEEAAEAPTEASAEAAAGEPTEAAADSPAVAARSAPEPYRHPMPENDKVLRCVKEWQVGEHRVKHIVRSLCEPFRDSGSTDTVVAAAMETVPKLADLKPGTPVAGVVVGVAGFGVFVELGPECSGLIHVSRVSEDFVEDLNEYVQIGDVVTAWVTEIDTKRRRVALSGISPERQAALRQQRPERAPRAGGGRTGGAARGGGRGGATAGGEGRGAAKTAGPGGGGGRSDRAPAGGGRESRGGGAGRGGPRGGGQGRAGGRDAKGSRGPSTYTTVARSDKPAAPISDAMRTGDEPLRSFGDLMQFFKGSREETAEGTKQGKTDKPKQKSAEIESEGTKPAAEADARETRSETDTQSAQASPDAGTPPAESGGKPPEIPQPEKPETAQPEANSDAASPDAAAEEGAASGSDRAS